MLVCRLLAAAIGITADYEVVVGFGTDPAAPARIRKSVLPRAGGNASTVEQANGFLATKQCRLERLTKIIGNTMMKQWMM